MVKICSDMNLQKSAVAVVVTCMTVSYGLGQIISGALGDKFKPQHIISAGIALAVICNVLMYFSTAVWNMAVIWTVNGFAHSLMWPPILKIFTSCLNDYEYGYGVVRVSWGSSVASVVLYLLCPLMLRIMEWRTIILICAGIGFAVLIIWVVMNPRALKGSESENTQITGYTAEKVNVKSSKKLPKAIYLPICLIMAGIILQGILRDGVTNWMPSFLLETFDLPEENAIICTVILAVFSIISFGLFNWVNTKFFRDEVKCSSFIFLMASVSSVLLYLTNRFFDSVVLSMLMMALIVSCMHGINLMLIGIAPKRFAKINKVSTFSGLLNSCTYIGAAASTYCFAVLTEKFGWNFTVFTWIIISVLGTVVCKIASLAGWPKKFSDYLS